MVDFFIFRRWAEYAVSGIIFPGDKKKVYQELMDHMEDHYDGLVGQGMDEEAAREAVEKAMGDPWAVAKDLAAIHQPFWGYFLRATRVILVLVLIATLFPLSGFLQEHSFRRPGFRDWDVFDENDYGGDTNRTLLHLSDQDSSFESDGYTFTATDAAVYRDDEHEITFFHCRVQQFNPIPWSYHGEVGYWFWAEDSLGNYYYSQYETAQDEDPRKPAMYGNMSQTGILTHTYEFWINDIPDAQWLKIHYTRDGRDEMLFIDLTGGASK